MLLGYVTRPNPQPHPGQILLTFQPHAGLSLALQGPTLVVQVKLLLSVPPCFLPLSLGCPCDLPTDIPQAASPGFGHPATSCPSCRYSPSFPWVPALGFPKIGALPGSSGSLLPRTPFCPKGLKCHPPWPSDHLPHTDTQGTTPLGPQTTGPFLFLLRHR